MARRPPPPPKVSKEARLENIPSLPIVAATPHDRCVHQVGSITSFLMFTFGVFFVGTVFLVALCRVVEECERQMRSSGRFDYVIF
jgi:hypothetical protein